MPVEDAKGKKRKGASDSAPKAKKPRKSDDITTTTAAAKPAKAAKSATVPAVSKKPVKARPARKEAADFFSDDEAPTAEPTENILKPTKGKKKNSVAVTTGSDLPEPIEVDEVAPKAQDAPKKQGKKVKTVSVDEAPVVEKTSKAKKSKKAEAAPVEEDATVEVQEETSAKKSKKIKSGKKEAKPEDVSEVVAVAEEVDGEVEEDDQTAALLAGFESDDEDEKDPDDDADFDENATVPAVTKKQRTALEKALKGAKSNEPGVVYVGRVPRGFFEPEMKKYFSQFGRVTRLRLSRNKQTGASKHYAFIEFQSTEVADIVARTMNNYLLFGHILKCKLIPADQVHPDLFKGGWPQRFKVDPRNKKAGLQMERGVERGQWEKRVEAENKRRTGRNKQLKEEFGYEFSAPSVKTVDAVPKTLENGEAQEQLAVAATEETPVEEHPKAKKGKKSAKAVVEQQPAEIAQAVPEKKGRKAAKSKVDVEADIQAEIAAEVGAPTPEKKVKKDKKRKSDAFVESTAVVGEIAPIEITPKGKKGKKEAKDEQEVAKPKKAKKVKA